MVGIQPWDGLKALKNLIQIKNMSQKIFIDCGTNLCQGLSSFIDKFKIDESWIVYSFEANPNSFKMIDKNKFKFVRFENKAVWISNETLKLNVERYPSYINDSKISIRSDIEPTDLVGGGTNIMGNNHIFNHNNSDMSQIDVECFNFSEFIMKNFKIDDIIIIKLDIEGAEYQVLEQMISDGSINFINEIYIEFHNHLLIDKFDEDKIKNEIISLGIKLTEWI
jgi:FkbM family methyltransferase